MAAVCPYNNCGWSGSATHVTDGGRCPECGAKVRYESKPLESSGIKDVREFNRRAAKAIRGIRFGESPSRFTNDIAFLIEHGRTLSEAQQQGLYNVVYRYRGQVTDKDLVDYATHRAKGYSA